MITVLHASNLPFRSAVTDPDPPEDRKQSLSVLEIEPVNDTVSSPVTPFVEAVFQRQTVRTMTADGSQATWNQTLDLTLKSPNGDLSPATLSNIIACLPRVSDLSFLHQMSENQLSDRKDIIPERCSNDDA